MYIMVKCPFAETENFFFGPPDTEMRSLLLNVEYILQDIPSHYDDVIIVCAHTTNSHFVLWMKNTLMLHIIRSL